MPLILDGTKTVTRRLQGLDEINFAPNRYKYTWKDGENFGFSRGNTIKRVRCPFGHVGDFLYVKETFHQVTDNVFIYQSDNGVNQVKWTASRFMPKAAARTWLQIVDIDVERLSDITLEDISAEGINVQPGRWPFYMEGVYATEDAFQAWTKLFTKLNGPLITEQDPWVWVIRFERVEKPLT